MNMPTYKRAMLLALAIGFAAGLSMSLPTSLSGQSSQTFAGKAVQLVIGFGPGGLYDLWGRTLARHIGRHLPGSPLVTPQNMEGAGSYRAANFIYNVAPKDGSVFAIIARDVALGPLTGTPGARFVGTKLSWIGSPAKETSICIAYDTAQVK